MWRSYRVFVAVLLLGNLFVGNLMRFNLSISLTCMVNNTWLQAYESSSLLLLALNDSNDTMQQQLHNMQDMKCPLTQAQRLEYEVRALQ